MSLCPYDSNGLIASSISEKILSLKMISDGLLTVINASMMFENITYLKVISRFKTTTTGNSFTSSLSSLAAGRA